MSIKPTPKCFVLIPIWVPRISFQLIIEHITPHMVSKLLGGPSEYCLFTSQSVTKQSNSTV